MVSCDTWWDPCICSKAVESIQCIYHSSVNIRLFICFQLHPTIAYRYLMYKYFFNRTSFYLFTSCADSDGKRFFFGTCYASFYRFSFISNHNALIVCQSAVNSHGLQKYSRFWSKSTLYIVLYWRKTHLDFFCTVSDFYWTTIMFIASASSIYFLLR